ncbi:unnamed protein product [Microthlaspi erraticum]|uniref:Arabidopsis retrotransposon Orf1 C-terminal domain-containing protein n=1 Tax=Microthlaspi erraticum TaxID=1685480 RepID=A0A6D2J0F4_9BRAS|nr:unnamed protein product [Microthlaspi erraticum]
MAKTKFTKKPVQSEGCGSEWRCGSVKGRKREGRRRWTIVEEKGRPKGVGPKWPETAGQDMDDSMIPDLMGSKSASGTGDEFLASLKLKKHPQGAAAELKRDGIGYITFTLLGQEYLLSMKELETIYNLEEDRDFQQQEWLHQEPGDTLCPQGDRQYPFARHDCSNVTTQELELLDEGIIQKLKLWMMEPR